MRCRQLIGRLMNASAPMRIKDIAEAFAVSERSIKYDLECIRLWLSQQAIQAEVLSRPGRGIWLKGTEEEKASLRQRLVGQAENRLVLHSEERIRYQSLLLLTASGFLTFAKLTEWLGVSRNTVLQDMQGVEELLARWQLQIERKAHRGIRVKEGNEIKRRLLLEYLLQTFLDRREMAMLLQGLQGLPSSQDVMTQLLQKLLVSSTEMQTCYQWVGRLAAVLRDEVQRPLQDREIIALLVRLCVSVQRSRQGAVVETVQPAVVNPVYDCFRQALTELSAELDVSWSTAEVNFIALPFSSPSSAALSAEGVTMRLLQTVSTLSQIPFSEDHSLYESLRTHLQDKWGRHEYGVMDPNPLLADVLRRYPERFAQVREAVYEVLGPQNIFLNDADIAYLVLHFQAAYERRFGQYRCRTLLVCSTGRGSARLLKARLENENQALQIIGQCAVVDLPQIVRWQAIDLVVSVLPVTVSVPSIVVNAIPTEQDLAALDAAVRQLQAAQPAPRPVIAEPEQPDALSYPAALEELSQEIISQGFQIGMMLTHTYRAYLNEQASAGLMLHCLLMMNRLTFGSAYLDINGNETLTSEQQQVRDEVHSLLLRYEANIPESEIRAILRYFAWNEGETNDEN